MPMKIAEDVVFQEKVVIFSENWHNGRGSCHEVMVQILQ